MSETATRLVTDLDLVHRLVRDRDALRPGFAIAWRTISRADPALQRAWAAATLELARVHAGIPAMEAFWRLDPPNPAAGIAAADICRHAGARAALACLQALPTATRLLGPAGIHQWWHAMARLAREASNVVAPVAARLTYLLASGDDAAFVDFVAAGLKATATDKRRRVAFFTGSDPLADALLARRPDTQGFAETERMLTAFVAGLWGGTPRLRAFPPAPQGTLTRPTIASGTVILPASYPGTSPDRIAPLYRAAAAHAHAHLTAPPVLLPIASLRPIQRVLVGLIEDARVEALAIARFPGLRALWSPFHIATPSGNRIALSLLARLARALLDPAYADPDGFVDKGRSLFAAADPNDPTISRTIGSLLGNDLGQMRIQFNAKTYVVDPAYRDDNMHLWDLPETPDDSLALSVDTARNTPDPDPAPRARDAGQDDRAAILATYPEWDAAARTLRPDWVTIRDAIPLRRPVTDTTDPRLHADLARLIRSVAIGPRRRRPPHEDGEDLDLDRAIAAVTARRTGLAPDPRLYRDRAPTGRDLATLLILDSSQSTAARTPTGLTILDVQRRAAAALAAALHARGDRFALRSFASAGRDDIRVTRLKDFAEPFAPIVLERLAGLQSGLSTRVGAALRHAGAELAPLPTTRKLVLVLTDGEPSDIDVANPAELVEDARRAILDLRQRGIDVYGIVMDPTDAGSGPTIFGRHNTMLVRRLEDLPARLTDMYFRLAQR